MSRLHVYFASLLVVMAVALFVQGLHTRQRRDGQTPVYLSVTIDHPQNDRSQIVPVERVLSVDRQTRLNRNKSVISKSVISKSASSKSPLREIPITPTRRGGFADAAWREVRSGRGVVVWVITDAFALSPYEAVFIGLSDASYPVPSFECMMHSDLGQGTYTTSMGALAARVRVTPPLLLPNDNGVRFVYCEVRCKWERPVLRGRAKWVTFSGIQTPAVRVPAFTNTAEAGLAVCVTEMNSQPSPRRSVEFIEYYRQLGATDVFFYDPDASTVGLTLLALYADDIDVRVTIVDWSLVYRYPSMGHGQALAMNHCKHSARPRARLVMTANLEEYLHPSANVSNWLQLAAFSANWALSISSIARPVRCTTTTPDEEPRVEYRHPIIQLAGQTCAEIDPSRNTWVIRADSPLMVWTKHFHDVYRGRHEYGRAKLSYGFHFQGYATAPHCTQYEELYNPCNGKGRVKPHSHWLKVDASWLETHNREVADKIALIDGCTDRRTVRGRAECSISEVSFEQFGGKRIVWSLEEGTDYSTFLERALAPPSRGGVVRMNRVECPQGCCTVAMPLGGPAGLPTLKAAADGRLGHFAARAALAAGAAAIVGRGALAASYVIAPLMPWVQVCVFDTESVEFTHESPHLPTNVQAFAGVLWRSDGALGKGLRTLHPSTAAKMCRVGVFDALLMLPCYGCEEQVLSTQSQPSSWVASLNVLCSQTPLPSKWIPLHMKRHVGKGNADCDLWFRNGTVEFIKQSLKF